MLIIYFDAEKKHKQVVRPTAKFDGQWLKLVEHITNSDNNNRHYHSFEVI